MGFLVRYTVQQATLPPALPVLSEDGSPPFPRSSSPSWITMARPTIEYWPDIFRTTSLICRQKEMLVTMVSLEYLCQSPHQHPARVFPGTTDDVYLRCTTSDLVMNILDCWNFPRIRKYIIWMSFIISWYGFICVNNFVYVCIQEYAYMKML